jgi:TPR repeat protein
MAQLFIGAAIQGHDGAIRMLLKILLDGLGAIDNAVQGRDAAMQDGPGTDDIRQVIEDTIERVTFCLDYVAEQEHPAAIVVLGHILKNDMAPEAVRAMALERLCIFAEQWQTEDQVGCADALFELGMFFKKRYEADHNHQDEADPNHQDEADPNHQDEADHDHQDEADHDHQDEADPNHQDEADPNLDDAARFLSMAADRRHAEAQFQLGMLLLDTGITDLFETAISLLVAAAAQGDPRAMGELLRILLPILVRRRVRNMTLQDMGRSATCVRFMTDNEQVDVMCNLGLQALEDGEDEIGVNDYVPEHAISMAAQLLRAAARQGSARARYALWRLYLYGVGVALDHKEAYECLRLAAQNEEGYEEQCAEAQYEYAMQMRRTGAIAAGANAAGANAIADEYLRRAANNGFAEAQSELGMVLFRNAGTNEAALAEAGSFIEAAANQSHPEALHQLGVLFRDGIGRERNLGEAVRCSHMAASRGVGVAEYREFLQNVQDTLPNRDDILRELLHLPPEHDVTTCLHDVFFPAAEYQERERNLRKIGVGWLYNREFYLEGTEKLLHLAANKGDPRAIFEYGISLLCGIGGGESASDEEDIEEARNFIRNAADLEYPPAMCRFTKM